MGRNNDTVEFYNVNGKRGHDLIAATKTSIIPRVGTVINIRRQTWEVVVVSYDLNDADDSIITRMRANVGLKRYEDNQFP